jgi:RHS repeat-associated protein
MAHSASMIHIYSSTTAFAACASRFTGKERDTESGLDYFGARYYASSMGRWMSPDYSDGPVAVPFGDLGDPQSLNLYGYVGNSPLTSLDEDGHCYGQQASSVFSCIGGFFKTVFAGGSDSYTDNLGNLPFPTPPPPGVPLGYGTPAQRLVDAQGAVRANDSWESKTTINPQTGKPETTTFCNYACRETAQRILGANPKEWDGRANDIAAQLAKSGNFHRVGPAEAQRLANQGKLVIGAWANPNPGRHGHVVTVVPDNTYFGQAFFPNHNSADPLINDIGTYRRVISLSDDKATSFVTGVKFYAQN